GKQGEQGKQGERAEQGTKAEEPRVPTSESFHISISLPRYSPSGILALTGARIVTMKGDEILPSADIVITGNRITAIGTSGSVTIPSGATRMDATGTTIGPGLVDT